MKKENLDIESSGNRTPTKTALQIIQTYFNVINHAIIFTVAIYMSFLCYNAGNLPISWHAWLCTMGYQLLMTEAIMSFYSQNVWSQQHSRKTKRTLHWLMQAVGSIGAITGMIIEFWQKQNHFQSTHAKLGLSAGIFTAIGMLNGISALWSIELRAFLKPLYWKFIHNLAGITAFVLGMVTLYHGYDKKYMIKNSREDIRMWLQAVAIATIVLSTIGALRTFYVQIRSICATVFGSN